jgi:hypothetical protein
MLRQPRVIGGTFKQSARLRKKVEMRFAHLKRNLRFRRLRLRGLTGAKDEFPRLADDLGNDGLKALS